MKVGLSLITPFIERQGRQGTGVLVTVSGVGNAIPERGKPGVDGNVPRGTGVAVRLRGKGLGVTVSKGMKVLIGVLASVLVFGTKPTIRLAM